MATPRFLPIVNFVLSFSAIGISAGVLFPHQGGLDAKIEAVRLAHEQSLAHHLKQADKHFHHVEQHVAHLVLQQARLEAVIRARFPEAKEELDAPLPDVEDGTKVGVVPVVEVVEVEAVPVVDLDVVPEVVIEEVVVLAPATTVGDPGETKGAGDAGVALVADEGGPEVKVVGERQV